MAPKSASPSKAKATATKAAGVKKTKKDKDPNAPKVSDRALRVCSMA